MADGESNISTEKDAVELEAMRKGSFSWHPCRVSLCSSGSGLIVEYEDNHPKEVISDKEEILSRIHARSIPLQGDDCSSLEQGNHVLAQTSLAGGAFYDAQVEKAVCVRHSKRTRCRCSFTIKWLNQSMGEETPTLPASAVMKLSTKSINLHPTISTFFSMLEYTNGLDNFLCSKIIDNMNWETDISVLLEKQIEDISNATELPHKKISSNIVYGLAADVRGLSQGKTADASLKESNARIPLLNDLKVLTWNVNDEPLDISVKSSPGSNSLIQEGPSRNILPLSPLAARAALASSKSEFPQITDSTIEHCSSVANGLSLKVSDMSINRSLNFKGVVKTLFPEQSAAQAVKSSDVSSRSHVKGSKKKNKIPEKDMSRPSEMRLTRSRMQKTKGLDESSGINGVKGVDFAKNDECLSEKDEMTAEVEREKVIFSEDPEKHNCLKRITRSAAREEAKKGNQKPEPKLGKTSFSESDEEDVLKGNGSTHSKRVKTTPKTIGATGNSKGTGEKCVNSTKQETRFSPRLKFLPRTRSQTKT